MGSSFEELVAGNPTVKTDLNFDTRIKSYNFSQFLIPLINAGGIDSMSTWDLTLSFLVQLKRTRCFRFFKRKVCSIRRTSARAPAS